MNFYNDTDRRQCPAVDRRGLDCAGPEGHEQPHANRNGQWFDDAWHHSLLQESADRLYSADPGCAHVIVDGDHYSGIKCAKCPGWFCW